MAQTAVARIATSLAMRASLLMVELG